MSATRLHADEVAIDAALAGRLVASQFPAWRDLALTRIASGGTDNAIFRLGEEFCVRMPRYPAAAALVGREKLWLSRLAPQLPLAIPTPLAMGSPGEGYPFSWSICRWIAGEDAMTGRLSDGGAAARTLAGFIAALRAIDASGGPPCGDANFERGVPLAQRDRRVREAIALLPEDIDACAVARAWEEALAAPLWPDAPAWLHGDIHPGNLILRDGAIVAVIDFGCVGIGDPACDLQPAWTLFSAAERAIFRAHLAPDEASWVRGRGWALSVAVIALPYYTGRNPVIVGMARRAIDQILLDRGLSACRAS
ncbi:aminoglycoside phosphotransferase family protein [Bosea sp. PAMC 26642]|uniref:aminoglycoside phosphotransferase family protein n=1 Tax=Bosea sp. (strain PAMC 26642) TaxID=1792307 RepID=UPI0007700BA9|nr:aminoglycoside phosphotransferase family protein [Bosea sp. PAMC 26642]AMJ62848.1 phosphotransferase [Bosea sp. PAMC 26642]